jgi:hypothetical protein
MLLSQLLFAASATAIPTVLIEGPATLDSRALDSRALLPSISIPIDFTFGVRVPTSTSTSSDPLALLVNGYQLAIPQTAKSGTLVSWLANYQNGKAYTTQFTSINPSAPRNITTSSDSNSQDGGNSFTNATALASGQQARVVTTTFSSGDAASAAAAALNSTSSTSTASSGNSNSTAVATANALGDVLIMTSANTASANTASALNSQSIENAKGAEAASSCAADSGPAASAEAEQINTVLIPVGSSPEGDEMYWVKSNAYAACSAGVDAPSQGGSSSSSSGSQASLTGVRSTVTCNGATSNQQSTSTTFRITVKGTYTLLRGFSGAVGGQRVASSRSQC